MDQAEEAVPFQPVTSGRYSGHDMLQLKVFRSPQDWHEHWADVYHDPSGAGSCPEPDLAASMLVEVAVGATASGSDWVEITALALHDGVLRVQATLHRPAIGTADIGHPFAVVATQIRDRPVALDLSVVQHDPLGG